MARSKLQKTLADYLAIAVTPVLIMLLVGSLVFFLNELFQTGRYASRIRWILLWFVIGMVLVARIAIESGRAQASMFTLALGAVTSIAIVQFVPDSPWVPIVCLAIIWWCADKLTWDCSLIDDSEDASGEGLLQIAGVAEEAELKEDSDTSAKTEAAAPDASVESPQEQAERVPFWKRVFSNTSEREGKPHAPGLWVVYFSLAALPLFGFGQLAIPSANEASRDFAFRCLLVYVGAALGLLMLTSFLGLRRYLRQRNLEMPARMAATWVVMGTVIAAGILVTALLLPRPDSEYSVTAMIDSAADSLQEASDRAFLDDAGGEGEGEQDGPADERAEQGDANDPNQPGQPGGQQPGQQVAQNGQQDGQDGQAAGDKEPGDGPDDDAQGQQNNGNQTARQNDAEGSQKLGGDQNADSGEEGDAGEQDPQNKDDGDEREQQDENAGGGQVAQNEDAESPDGSEEGEDASESSADSGSSFMDSVMEMVGTLFKWIVYAILGAVVLYFVIRNWRSVAEFLQRLWHEFLSLFGRRPEPQQAVAEEVEEEAAAPPRPFSAFRNPFRSGAAAQHSPAELVRYTFEALQAWASEQGCGRSPDQTPMEFGQQLRMRRRDDVGPDAHELSQLYAQVAYAGHRPKDDSFPLLERVWRRLSPTG
jgi:hypothetical protein